MSTNKFQYSGPTAITCGIDGLASGAGTVRASSALDNTTNLYLDALVSLQLQTATGTLGTNPAVYVYVAGLANSTSYADGFSGTDATVTTFPSLPNVKLAQIVNYNVAANTTMYSSPFSVAACFGGIMPEKWIVIINNQTGLALSGTAGQQTNNIVSYWGVATTNS